MRCASFAVALLALFTGLYSYLNARLEQFYIFDPSHLHDLSQRAIAAHGNDTRSVVNFIVSELGEKVTDTHLNLDEEWVFNNAGGAMGAMYIIHASASPLLLHTTSIFIHSVCAKLYFPYRYHGVLDHFRYGFPCLPGIFMPLIARANTLSLCIRHRYRY